MAVVSMDIKDLKVGTQPATVWRPEEPWVETDNKLWFTVKLTPIGRRFQ